jgi:hypothetical protein
MSKESRRRQRAANAPGASPSGKGPSGGTPSAASSSGSAGGATATAGAQPSSGTRPASGGTRSSSGTSDRAGRRERVRYQPKRSFMERYRTAIISIAVIAAIVLIGAFVFTSAAQPAYACSNLFEPAPTASPAADASPQPGFVQPDMGNAHVALGAKVTYTNCPPASGRHYNATGAGPITPRLYSPTDTLIPQNWVHNLEHGALVLLYRGDSDAATPEGQNALRALYTSFPPSPICGIPAGSGPGPVFARFDDMAYPVAALVWDRVLPLQSVDAAAILQFYSIYAERANPEKQCETPSASPPASTEPSGSPAASGSLAPSASAAPGTSTEPSVSPAAPSAAPSDGASPSPS